VAGAISVIVAQRTGEVAEARIVECRTVGGRYRSASCTGMWVAGGSLLEGGRVERGTVEGATRGDIGKTLDVRISGDRAYTPSLRTPIVLGCIGLALAAFGGSLLRRRISAAA